MENPTDDGIGQDGRVGVVVVCRLYKWSQSYSRRWRKSPGSVIPTVYVSASGETLPDLRHHIGLWTGKTLGVGPPPIDELLTRFPSGGRSSLLPAPLGKHGSEKKRPSSFPLEPHPSEDASGRCAPERDGPQDGSGASASELRRSVGDKSLSDSFLSQRLQPADRPGGDRLQPMNFTVSFLVGSAPGRQTVAGERDQTPGSRSERRRKDSCGVTRGEDGLPAGPDVSASLPDATCDAGSPAAASAPDGSDADLCFTLPTDVHSVPLSRFNGNLDQVNQVLAVVSQDSRGVTRGEDGLPEISFFSAGTERVERSRAGTHLKSNPPLRLAY
ncbi:Hypothetical protein SMAX5B_007106 [Scophthalmus maximus]|uniref:Uncharacterized protein n=1 Tax=Scophthalmus maximus TaxID=52904 RepID=A0A2U9B0H3_SCOMX|nr:Hypothetical protein SMAX5B_007106 [Scophthalmus maximus]